MNNLIFILLLFSPLKISSDYPIRNGRPTSEGIEQYIEDKSEALILEYQKFVGDTLYDIWLYAEDLTFYDVSDSLELGRYYPNEIYISTAELFMAYELADISQEQRDVIEESNKFVKAIVIHELTHGYLNQISLEMRSVDSISVNRSYQTSLWLIRSHETFGTTFIEEGICEYMAEKMGEVIPPKSPFIPRTIEDLMNRDYEYQVNYKYASHYLKIYLDTAGFKKGVKVLLHNSPPTYMEILKPELFFGRLNSIK